MAQSTEVGSSWGHVTVIHNFTEEETHENQLTGEVYKTGNLGPSWIVFSCDCDREFRVKEHEFKGRRRTQNCGHITCPYTKENIEEKKKRDKPGRPPASDPGSNMQWYIKGTTQQAVREYAQAHEISMSKAADRLLRQILELD